MARFGLKKAPHTCPTICCSLFRHFLPNRDTHFARRKFSGDEAQLPRQPPGLFVTAKTVSVMSIARRKISEIGSGKDSRLVKRAANGGTRAAIIKKKLMKTQNNIEASQAPANADQLSPKQRKRFTKKYVITISGETEHREFACSDLETEIKTLSQLHAAAFIADQVEMFWQVSLENRTVKVEPTK